ncbi:hypothetical protein [Streptomyces roseolus]|uniref:hypothetical protein n=1 Tax=Streptomyces roseolus TaxID=67358 RepID=UPI00364E2B50
MTQIPTPPVPPAPEPEAPGPLLTAHATLIFLAAAFIGAVVGVLTSFSTGNTAAALLAGLTACGVSIPILHKLIH